MARMLFGLFKKKTPPSPWLEQQLALRQVTSGRWDLAMSLPDAASVLLGRPGPHAQLFGMVGPPPPGSEQALPRIKQLLAAWLSERDPRRHDLADAIERAGIQRWLGIDLPVRPPRPEPLVLRQGPHRIAVRYPASLRWFDGDEPVTPLSPYHGLEARNASKPARRGEVARIVGLALVVEGKSLFAELRLESPRELSAFELETLRIRSLARWKLRHHFVFPDEVLLEIETRPQVPRQTPVEIRPLAE